jgi:hypothetical protein
MKLVEKPCHDGKTPSHFDKSMISLAFCASGQERTAGADPAGGAFQHVNDPR